MTNQTNNHRSPDGVEELPCPLTRLAEHFLASGAVGSFAERLDYSLNRCGLVVVPEQSLTRPESESVTVMDDIAVMMSEFVDNWPQPKRIETALALIAKTIRIALNPPRHDYWGAGEADCPREIKASNGELHTMRCKVCEQDNPRDDRCLAKLSHGSVGPYE